MPGDDDSVWALGLMSGTSLDGVDAALLRNDGERIQAFGPWLTMPYSDCERARLRDVTRSRGDMLLAEQEITQKHAEAVKLLLEQAGMTKNDVHVIGFHGQTVIHRPLEHLTWQIGNGALLAELTGVDVVCDFRRRDLAAGGEGAPLIPLYHAALARAIERPMAVLNIGGIANVTWIGRSQRGNDLLDQDILAFDTGPGNVMVNEWALEHTGHDCDLDGRLALAGRVDASIIETMLKHAYFLRTPPKSLDRNDFGFEAVKHLSVADGLATLTEFMAAAVERGSTYFPEPAKRWFITGGGRHNPAFMHALRKRLGPVEPVEALGWSGDALEAQGFAFLAVRSLKGLPLSLPTTTGALRPVTGGAFYRA